MAQTGHKATISAYVTRTSLKAASGSPAELHTICKKAGVDPSVLEDPEARLPVARFEVLLQEVEKRSDDPNLGLTIGRALARNHPGGNILLGMMANCPTLGAALEKFFLYHDVMADAIQPRMNVEGDQARLFWEVRATGLHVPRPVAEALLSVFVHALGLLTEGAFRPLEVRFTHARPSDVREHEKTFGGAVLFDSPRSELVMERSWLSAPIHLANPGICEALEQFAHQMLVRLHASAEWTDRVMERIGRNLVKGKDVGLASMARDLGLGARSLQNRLRDEGTSYKAILNSVRREMAMRCLRESNDPICDIAFLLGFSDQSAFNHAFRRWTGHTPKAYRNQGD